MPAISVEEVVRRARPLTDEECDILRPLLAGAKRRVEPEASRRAS
jgi:hypothetical protein